MGFLTKKNVIYINVNGRPVLKQDLIQQSIITDISSSTEIQSDNETCPNVPYQETVVTQDSTVEAIEPAVNKAHDASILPVGKPIKIPSIQKKIKKKVSKSSSTKTPKTEKHKH